MIWSQKWSIVDVCQIWCRSDQYFWSYKLQNSGPVFYAPLSITVVEVFGHICKNVPEKIRKR